MSQNAVKCPTLLHICKLRVTRLNQLTGAVATPTANNHYVTDKVVSLEVTPEILDGEKKELISGCDCVVVAYRGKDKILRYNLKLELAAFEPGLLELLTGSTLIADNSTVPVPMGLHLPDQVQCTTPGQPMVAIEAWGDLYIKDSPDVTWPYYRFVLPGTFWQLDSWTMENELSPITLNGWSRQNPTWTNPYLDLPNGMTTIQPQGSIFFDSSQPAAYCGYSTTST